MILDGPSQWMGLRPSLQREAGERFTTKTEQVLHSDVLLEVRKAFITH